MFNIGLYDSIMFIIMMCIVIHWLFIWQAVAGLVLVLICRGFGLGLGSGRMLGFSALIERSIVSDLCQENGLVLIVI